MAPEAHGGYDGNYDAFLYVFHMILFVFHMILYSFYMILYDFYMILYGFYIFLTRAFSSPPKHTLRGMTLLWAAEAPAQSRHIRAHTPCGPRGAKGEPCRP